MQSHHDGEGWTPMEAGVAPKVWRPRPTAADAVHKCLEWTGLVCIPAMRVVDLSSGVVLWQDRWDQAEPDLERVLPDWAVPIYAQVKAEQRAQMDRERELVVGGVTTDLGAAADETIAAMLGAVGVAAPAVVPAPVDDGALFTMGEFDV